MSTREGQWQINYEKLKEYILEHHLLPDKKKVEHRGLLNWWKYNMKLIKQGKMSAEKESMSRELGNMRDKQAE